MCPYWLTGREVKGEKYVLRTQRIRLVSCVVLAVPFSAALLLLLA
jgi:hypothetical protein